MSCSRRRFLEGALAAASGLAVPSVIGCQKELSQPKSNETVANNAKDHQGEDQQEFEPAYLRLEREGKLADRQKKTPLDTTLKVGTWIRDYCWERGMILRNNGDILVIAPALVMSRDELGVMLDLMEEAIAAAVKHFHL